MHRLLGISLHLSTFLPVLISSPNNHLQLTVQPITLISTVRACREIRLWASLDIPLEVIVLCKKSLQSKKAVLRPALS